jgi:hypothetical protein
MTERRCKLETEQDGNGKMNLHGCKSNALKYTITEQATVRVWQCGEGQRAMNNRRATHYETCGGRPEMEGDKMREGGMGDR